MQVHVSQQRDVTEMPCHLKGVNLDNTQHSEEQKHERLQFLTKWRHVFSKGETDLGRTDLVKHEIHIENK